MDRTVERPEGRIQIHIHGARPGGVRYRVGDHDHEIAGFRIDGVMEAIIVGRRDDNPDRPREIRPALPHLHAPERSHLRLYAWTRREPFAHLHEDDLRYAWHRPGRLGSCGGVHE